jgi:hypothetical protein
MSPVAALRSSAAPAAALAILLAAGAAEAQLRAETVWQAWQDYSAQAGQTMQAGTVARNGAELTASKVRIASTADDVVVAMSLDSIVFAEQADGTVTVGLPDAYDMRMSGPGDQRIVINIRHPGMRMVVSQGETGLVHAMTAPEMSIGIGEFSVPDGGPEVMNVAMTALGVEGSYNLPGVPGGPSNTEFAIRALDAGVEIRDDRGEFVTFDYAATGLGFGFAGAGLDQMVRMEEGDLAGALSSGLAMAFGFSYDALRYSFDMDADGTQAAGSGTAMAGQTRFVLDAGEFSFSSGSRNGELTLSGSELPLPQVTLKAAELGYGFSLPTTGAPTPQPATLLLRLVDLVLPDDVWAMADPSGQVARGPATLVLDLAAQLLLPADLFGMDTMFGYMTGGPMEAAQPTALDIRALQLRVAGAELTGDGSFTFDPTDMETVPGVPRPAGVLNLALRGGTQLLDTLVGMGVIPEDQAQGARMVLALFARPGANPDELVSKIELRDDGSVFANDMRLQ